jgi:hypothetical protein
MSHWVSISFLFNPDLNPDPIANPPPPVADPLPPVYLNQLPCHIHGRSIYYLRPDHVVTRP